MRRLGANHAAGSGDRTLAGGSSRGLTPAAAALGRVSRAFAASARASAALVIAAAVLTVIVLSIVPGCTERGFSSDLYVLEELETASQVSDPEERVERLAIFTGNHPQHPYRVIGYRRLFEALAGDIGDRERAAAYFDEVLASEHDPRVRGKLWYGRFVFLWESDRAEAVELAEQLCNGTERYYRLFFYCALYLMGEEGQADLAERCFVRSVDLAPAGRERAQVLGEYGAFLEESGRTDEALELLLEATSYAFANESLGRILWRRGEREAALDTYLRLVACVPGARKRIGLDSLYAIVYPGGGETSGRTVDERIMALRMAAEITLPGADFVDIEGRGCRLDGFRGAPLVLIAFNPT